MVYKKHYFNRVFKDLAAHSTSGVNLAELPNGMSGN
jgi:hypothetical protein